jgi:Ni,Fe-hydrogenase III small subunit
MPASSVGSSNGCDSEINALLNPVYDVLPDKKLVVAVGACSGRIHSGLPPRPQAILHGPLLALDRREQKIRAVGRMVELHAELTCSSSSCKSSIS